MISARDPAFAAGQLLERDLLAIANALDEREVGAGEHAEILAVLPVDPLDALGDHDPDPGDHLGVRRLLARRALAAPRAADLATKPPARTEPRTSGNSSPALSPR